MEKKGPNRVQKKTHRLFRMKPVSWFLSKAAHRVDKLTFKVSKGKKSFAGTVAGLPVVLVKTTGAKSGKIRELPLVAIPDGDNLILFASNWGKQKNPSWYYNLKANPVTDVKLKGETRTYLAEEVYDEVYDTYWEKAINSYKGYEDYAKRTDRRIPILCLTPQSSDDL